jgi:hypothetical protein
MDVHIRSENVALNWNNILETEFEFCQRDYLILIEFSVWIDLCLAIIN